MEAARKTTPNTMEPGRVLAVAAILSGIIAAAVNSDAWWFLLGLMAFVLLFLSSETPKP